MKTELITNVSHDLKTPLTSIINYTELLSKVEGLPEEARDYVSVIASKSDRLKRLTQDLFDISKAQSGNEEILWEKLDTQLLLQQTLGELDGEIRQSGLSFCVKTEPERYIFADGRKMSRVLGNLIQNTLKYAMKNTRVYLSAREEEGQVLLEIKNICQREKMLFLTVDGRTNCELYRGEVVRITKSPMETKLIRIKSCGFYKNLRQKMSDSQI